MTRIYLVRHAEAEGNLYRIAHGHYNGLITARGYKQIEVLRRRFEHIPIDAVYSSDLFRTRTTAKAVYLPKGLALHTDPNLREVNMGVWEGQTWQQLRMEDEERIVDFNRHLDRWQVPDGETAQQVLDRFIPALTKIAQENDGKTVAVFSHGAALRIVLGTLEGRPLSELGSTPHGDNTAISLLEYDEDGFTVLYRDDNHHLIDAHLSTFAKQKWWKDERMLESDMYYLPMTDREREELGISPEGEAIAVLHGDELAGGLQLLPWEEPGVGWIGYYGLLPQWRGLGRGIAPLGQAVQYYRARGVDHIRLRCPDEKTEGFFRHYGFEKTPEGDMELYIGYGEDA